jgi:hypothetical protein
MFFTHSRHRIVTAVSVAALTMGAAVAAIGDAHAATIGPQQIELAATALKPAIRLSQTGVIMFPMNPLPKCALSKTSFGQPRPPDRTHEGIDLMASLGQEVYAVDNGVLTKQVVDGAANATLSGNAWTLTMTDKTVLLLRSTCRSSRRVGRGLDGDPWTVDRLRRRHGRPGPGQLPPPLRGASRRAGPRSIPTRC